MKNFICFILLSLCLILSANLPIQAKQTKISKDKIYIRFKKDYSEQLQNNKNFIKINGVNLGNSILDKKSSLKYNFEKNKYILQNNNSVAKLLEAEEPLLRTYKADYNGSDEPEKYCMQLMRDNPEIEIAEPVYIDKILAVPNDTYYSQQVMLQQIGAKELWQSDLMNGDPNVVIGISDNGIFQDHQDISGNIAINQNEIPNNNIDDDNNGYVDDYRGYNFTYSEEGTAADNTYIYDSHGTQTSSIAAASTNNGLGISGVGYKCKLFPIKTSYSNASDDVPYGYESIIYAGVRGFKVLNCSWGSVKPFSDIEQSIIDFAVSRGVSVVAAAGNEDNSTSIVYPAGYRGVLGVGEVDNDDVLTGSSSIGNHAKILAPGIFNWACKSEQSTYQKVGNGTSFASPVIAGCLGLIRAYYPTLDARQAIEFARQCVDDVSAKNYGWEDILPGRINLMKALFTAPLNIPSIQPLSFQFLNSNQQLIDRHDVGETIYLKMNLKNFLGKATNVRFAISLAQDNSGSVSLQSPADVTFSEFNQDETKEVASFNFKLLQENISQIYFRIDVTADNGYKDFFLLPFVPTVDITTFENQKIKFSVSDRGNFGFNCYEDARLGVGFVIKNVGNQLWKSGLFVTENSESVISSVFGYGTGNNDFSNDKKFIEPEKNTGIINDNGALYKIGVQITQKFYLNFDTSTVAKIWITLKNISGVNLTDLAIGYFFDWDLGVSSDKNKVRLFPEAVPVSFGRGLAELTEYSNFASFPYCCGTLVFTDESGVEPQAAGFSKQSFNFFSDEGHINSLNRGSSIQYSEVGDVRSVVGMRFPGVSEPNSEHNIQVLVGCDSSSIALAQAIKTALSISDVAENNGTNTSIELYPNPVKDLLNMKVTNTSAVYASYKIINSLGKTVFDEQQFGLSPDLTINTVNLSNLPNGIYFVEFNIGNRTITKKIIISR